MTAVGQHNHYQQLVVKEFTYTATENAAATQKHFIVRAVSSSPVEVGKGGGRDVFD